MITPSNLRAVRTMRRAQSIRRAPWRWAPSIAWLLLADSLALTMLALMCSFRYDSVSRNFVGPGRGLDVLVGLAALFAGAAMVASCVARFRSWKMNESPAVNRRPIAPATAISRLPRIGVGWEKMARSPAARDVSVAAAAGQSARFV